MEDKGDPLVPPPFAPGQPCVLRIIWHGRIWEARPSIVVQDTPRLRAFYMPHGTVWKDASPDLRPAERLNKTWALLDTKWAFGGTLRLSIPGAAYSVIRLGNVDGSLYAWYVNLEDPLRQTEIGFDYEDSILDAIVSPDLASWRWKDEDELEEAVSAGLVSPEKAAAVHAEGKTVAAAIQSGRSIFNRWANWHSDPSWPVPVLPPGWDQV